MEPEDNSHPESSVVAGTNNKVATYWLTRYMILRLLGLIYAVAFLVAINQIIPLIGENGLLPAKLYLKSISSSMSTADGFVHSPSLFWFNGSDTALLTVAWIGFILSCLVMIGYANAIMMATLWFCYMSFVHTGQDWYGYGWEIQLLETGFLSIFLCPLFDILPFSNKPPPFPVIVLFRWLIFRIMLGSGLIKVRWDTSWMNGTALYYHFETQPMPGPLSRWFHFLPHSVLKIGVWFNFIAELAASWFVFWPKPGRYVAGLVIVLFQLTIFISGNLSFLNLLTIVPALACFDDAFLSKILPRRLVRKSKEARDNAVQSKPMLTTAWVITAIVVLLSIQPVINLISPGQIMNTSFDSFDLVNTYGAFGNVGKQRWNVVFEGTMDNDSTDNANWKPYIYKGLPVDPDKSSPQIAPYQLRLDWQMWFASMSSPNEYPWTVHLVWKLLHNDVGATSLFAQNPFPSKPPKYIRAVLYRYSFAEQGNPQHLWWNRQRVEIWLPPLSIDDPVMHKFLKAYGWIP
jgi:hypothetical protein